MPQIGERFNPYRLFHGIHIPEAVVKYRGISFGAKVLYGRLCRYKGSGERCNPLMGELAAEIGVSETQTRLYVKELNENGFIATDRRGQGNPNEYEFLWHECFNGDCGDSRKAPCGLEPQFTEVLDRNPQQTEVLEPPRTVDLEPQQTEVLLKSVGIESLTESKVESAPNGENPEAELSREDPIEEFCKSAYRRHRPSIKFKTNRRADEWMLERLHAAEKAAGADAFRGAFLRFLDAGDEWLRKNLWPMAYFLKNWEKYDSVQALPLPRTRKQATNPVASSEPANAPQASNGPAECSVSESIVGRWNTIDIPELVATWHPTLANNSAFNDPIFIREFDRLCVRVQEGYYRGEDARWLALKHLLKRNTALNDGSLNWATTIDMPIAPDDELPGAVRRARRAAKRERDATRAAAAAQQAALNGTTAGAALLVQG